MGEYTMRTSSFQVLSRAPFIWVGTVLTLIYLLSSTSTGLSFSRESLLGHHLYLSKTLLSWGLVEVV
jgi:hypothetical protein